MMNIENRVIAKVKRFKNGEWQSWEILDLSDTTSIKTPHGICRLLDIKLNRGGRFCFYARLLNEDTTSAVAKELVDKVSFRRYSFRSNYQEPRLHVLFNVDSDHSNKGNEGYAYHGIKMKGESASNYPIIMKLAEMLSKLFNTRWTIGINPNVYRNGRDSIGWHADDSQGERTILTVVIESPEFPRKLKVRTKKEAREGDEQYEFFPVAGDAYEMNGVMQEYYEHSVPKTKNKECQARRLVIVFRNGRRRMIERDSGIPTSIKDTEGSKPVTYSFGGLQHLQEGNLYSRDYLYSSGAHS